MTQKRKCKNFEKGEIERENQRMRREKEVSPDGGALSLFLSSGVSILPPPFLPLRNDAGKENPQKILRRWPKKEGGGHKKNPTFWGAHGSTQKGEVRNGGEQRSLSLLFYSFFPLFDDGTRDTSGYRLACLGHP